MEMTQISLAKRGVTTEEMKRVAKEEKIDVEIIRSITLRQRMTGQSRS